MFFALRTTTSPAKFAFRSKSIRPLLFAYRRSLSAHTARMSCPQCFTGHANPGTPKGREETIYNRRTYIAEPEAGKEAKGIIVIIPDAFGIDFVNNRILADHYASAAQFKVFLPDFMDGNAAPVSCMINMAHLWDERASWLGVPYYFLATVSSFVPFMIRNRLGVCWPRVISWLTSLREDTKTTLPVGVAGFCWGGLHAIKLTHDTAETRTSTGKPLIDVAFTAHPSSVTVPGDIEAVARPLSIAIGDRDAVMAIGQVNESKAILEGKKDVESEVVVYPGAQHGFSVRASRIAPDSKETKQAEEAEQQAIAWFQKQFAKISRS